MSCRGGFLQQSGPGAQAVVEGAEAEEFVGGVDLFVGDGVGQHDGLEAKDRLDHRRDGERAADADADRFFAVDGLDDALDGFEKAVVLGHRVGRRAGAGGLDFEVGVGWAVVAEVRGQGFGDIVRDLAWAEPAGDFGVGFGGDDGLAARAGVAAPDAVDFDCGAQPEAFEKADAWFDGAGAGADFGEEGGFVELKGFHAGDVGVAGRAEAVVEAFDGDAVAVVVKGRDQAGEDGGGVADGAAEAAGVKVVRRGADGDLHAEIAAAVDVDAGPAGTPAAAVGGEQDVGGEEIAVVFEDDREGAAADFFLAFEQELHVDGEAVVGGEPGLDGGDGDPEGRLVVRRAAGVDAVVLDGGFEGWGVPELDRVGGLDVVMAVDEQGGGAFGVEPVGVDGWVAAAIEELDVLEADFGQAGLEDVGGGGDAFCVGRVGGDAWDSDEVEQFFQQAGPVGFDPGF